MVTPGSSPRFLFSFIYDEWFPDFSFVCLSPELEDDEWKRGPFDSSGFSLLRRKRRGRKYLTTLTQKSRNDNVIFRVIFCTLVDGCRCIFSLQIGGTRPHTVFVQEAPYSHVSRGKTIHVAASRDGVLMKNYTTPEHVYVNPNLTGEWAGGSGEDL